MMTSQSLSVVPAEQAANIRPLFETDGLLEWNASIGAVLEGTCPGRAWTDDLDRPRAAFLITPEGAFLAGDSNLTDFQAAMRRLIDKTIFHPDGYRFRGLFLTCDAAWLDGWDRMFPYPAVVTERQHYVCTRPIHQERTVPEGFRVCAIDAALLDAPDVIWPEHVHEWIANNWCKQPNFLAHGLGAVTLHADGPVRRVVSWSLADAICTVNGVRCGEIGIHTLPEYRQRGLATLTAAAAVEYALERGWESVGWHCHTSNTGSARTALAAGFHHERDYTQYVCAVPETATQ